MPMPHIRHEIQTMLFQVEERIADAEHALASGDDRDKVKAAGDLTILRRRRALIASRLRAVDGAISQSESFTNLIKEEWFNLSLRLRQFLTGV